MKTIATFNPMHLGDNLVHLHFLRALAKAHPDISFTHGAPDQHLAQLYPLWQDIPNLRVCSLGEIPTGALNAWRGTEGHWYNHPDRLDFARYHVEAWFPVLAERMGLLSPFKKAEDMLFDYPALKADLSDEGPAKADILVINSEPLSGQAPFDRAAFDSLVSELADRGHIVATTAPSPCASFCTWDRRMDVTALGRLSQITRAIVGVSTGPTWTTMNIWNRTTVEVRVLLLNHEAVHISPNTTCTNHFPALRGSLINAGFL